MSAAFTCAHCRNVVRVSAASVPKRKYCSHECKLEGWKKTPLVPPNKHPTVCKRCPECGVEMMMPQWQAATKKTCSRRCLAAFNARRYSYTDAEFEAAFWSRVLPEPNSGCLLWDGPIDGANGYGKVVRKRRMDYPHRIAVLLSGRTIPPGLVVDHLCRVRLCVNPAHLEVVTERENIRRGMSPNAIKARARAALQCEAA